MFCREVKAFISPYLDGQLDSAQAEQLEEHVASCGFCRERLDLIEEIPVVLETDRMLAPHPGFTKVVMQQVIIRQQLRTGLLETDTTPFQVVSLAAERAKRVKTPGEYVLRFSSVAAGLVMLVGFGIYVLALTQGGDPGGTSAAVYGAIAGFAETLRAALSSPLELVAGIALAALALIGIWYLVRTMRGSQETTSQENRSY